MQSLFIFVLSFSVIFLVYLFVFYLRGLKQKTIRDSMQVRFLIARGHITKNDVNEKTIGIIICLIDPLIISLAGTISSSVKLGYLWQLLIGFALLMGLIYSIYEIVGRIIRRKCNKNGKHKRN